MNSDSIWIDLKTVAKIKNITPRALSLALAKGKYASRESITQGGKSYEILLSSLEPKVQEVYKNKYYSQIIEIEAQTQLIPLSKSEPTESGFIPETAKAIALARLDIIQEWNNFRVQHKPKHKGDRLFIDLYNSGDIVFCAKRFRGSGRRSALCL